MDKIRVFTFLSVSIQESICSILEKEYNTFSVLIIILITTPLMANSWLHLQLHKSLWPDKPGGVNEVLKRLGSGLRGKKRYLA